jgi:hypothetical protein
LVASHIQKGLSLWDTTEAVYEEKFDHKDRDTWNYYQKIRYIKEKYRLSVNTLVKPLPILFERRVSQKTIAQFEPTIALSIWELPHEHYDTLHGVVVYHKRGRRLSYDSTVAADYLGRKNMVRIFAFSIDPVHLDQYVKHEIAHCVWGELIPSSVKVMWKDFWRDNKKLMPTKYGKTNPSEGYAESYSFYFSKTLTRELHERTTNVLKEVTPGI